MFHIVVAMDRERGIGADGGLPWPKLKGDLKFYRQLTTSSKIESVKSRFGLTTARTPMSFDSFTAFKEYLRASDTIPETPDPDRLNAVIMGRRTWESLPQQFRPLPDRINIILTLRVNFDDEQLRRPTAVTATSLDEAIVYAQENSAANIFVIGGGQIYETALQHPECEGIFVTQIHSTFACDTNFPEFNTRFVQHQRGHCISESALTYHFEFFTKRRHET